MLNDPAPAISWSVVDWNRRRKAAYEVLGAAMSPVLICSEYPKESYMVGEEISLPLFVVNDLRGALGRLEWSWELYLEGTWVSGGSGETEIPADSVVKLGRAKTELPAPGRATLRLSLFGGGGANKTSSYELWVRSDHLPRRGSSAPGP
jgi:beta-mannosidase